MYLNMLDYLANSADEGMGAERPRKKEKRYLNCMPVIYDLTGGFCCCWCLALFNYKRYFYIGVFFDFIEWLKVKFIDLYYFEFFDSQLFLVSGYVDV